MNTSIWLCGNEGCTHRDSKRWHAGMAERIRNTLGPVGERDFEAAHPEPEPKCPVCGGETSRGWRWCWYCDDEPED